ncbi:MAG: PEGA domain-containing protein [Elusimicrobiota bacterium]
MMEKEGMIIDNRYAVVKKIGEGGFATVYKAWATNLEKYVAIKKIHEEYSQDAKFLDMFRDEAVNVAKLEHENIVRIIDFLRTTDNIYYIIMEYVKGIDLRKVLDKAKKLDRKLPYEISAHVVSAVLKAIDYAYFKVDEITGKTLQVVHRDISPGNIMIYFDGRTKLTDFGIAKAASGPGEKTGFLRGKIAYMSPEQAEGNVKLDNRSDVFSVGVIFYELVTGQRLFEGDSEYNTWQRVKKGRIDLRPLRPLDKKNVPSVPEELVDILLRSLEKDRRCRYQTGREMYIDLQRYLNRRKYGNYQEDVALIINELMKEEIEKDEADSREEKEKTLPGIMEKSSNTKNSTPSPVKITPLSPPPVPGATPTPPRAPIPSEKITAPVLPETQSTASKDSPVEDVKEETGLIEPASANPILSSAVVNKQGNDNPLSHLPDVPPLAAPPEEKEEREKTVFDFVLDTAKKYRRIFITTSLSVFLAAASFQILDVFNQWTSWGSDLHNYLWPPAIYLDSIPSEAKVFLVSQEKNTGVLPSGAKTPILIDKILTGNYLLTLEKSGYNKIERSITVFGDEDKISMKGSVQDNKDPKVKARNKFIVPFEVDLEINSNPQGASVYIDGRKFPCLTPLTQSLEVGKHTLKLILDGFEPIGTLEEIDANTKCNLDLAAGLDKQKGLDHRYWELTKRSLKDSNALMLTGKFWKNISVKSEPGEAAIYIDDESQPRGLTPQPAIEVTSGIHRLRLSKPGFETFQKEIEITAQKDVKLAVALKKIIFFTAYEKNKVESDIEARVVIKGSGINSVKTTPFRIALPLDTYQVYFSKEPQYEPQRYKVNIANLTAVKGLLEFKNPILNVFVGESLADKTPVADAEIYVNDKLIGVTNSAGRLEKSVAPGKSQIRVVTGGRYAEKVLEKELNVGQTGAIDCFLTIPDDGALIVDTRPRYFGAQIFVDGKLIGETIRKLENLSRQAHNVKVKHPELKKDLAYDVEYKKINQLIILKIDEQDKLYEEAAKNE